MGERRREEGRHEITQGAGRGGGAQSGEESGENGDAGYQLSQPEVVGVKCVDEARGGAEDRGSNLDEGKGGERAAHWGGGGDRQ